MLLLSFTFPSLFHAAYWLISDNEVYDCVGGDGIKAGSGTFTELLREPWTSWDLLDIKVGLPRLLF